MNEQAIVKFLEGIVNWRMRFVEFDPINDIRHAFMVVEPTMKKADADMFDIGLEDGKWSAYFTYWDGSYVMPSGKTGKQQHDSENFAAPQAICIAAARALATDAQLVEFGL